MALLGLILVLGRADIAEAIASASIPPLIATLTLTTTLYPIAAWRWAYVTNRLEQRQLATYLEFLQVRSIAAAGGFFAPRELVELGGRTVWLARSKGLPYGRAGKAVLVDRFCDVLIGGVALSGALSFWLLDLSALPSFTIGLVCLLAAIGITPSTMRAASGFIRRLNSRINRVVPTSVRDRLTPS